MKNKKTLTILLIVVALVVVAVPTLVIADDVTGNITITSNSMPQIDTFAITGSPTAFTPNVPYSVSLAISDADTMDNISSVMMHIWYTTTAGDPADFGSMVTGSNNSQVESWIMIDDGANTFIPDNTNTTWAGTLTSANKTGSATSHTYTFDLTFGQEAQEVATPADTDKWVIAVKVTDANSNEAFAVYSPGTPLGVNWYGGMDITTGAAPQWNTGTANMDFTGTAAQVFDGSYPMTLTANGNYVIKTYVSNVWTDSLNGAKTLTYDATVASANTFAIAVDTVDTYSAVTAQLLPTDTLTSGHTDEIIINDDTTPARGWGVGTDYDGDIVTNVYMFLKTHATMTESDGTYQGTVTFNIEND